jgi:hypothetical protein
LGVKAMMGKKRIVLAGRAREIKALLQACAKQHKLVKDWIDSLYMD